MTAVIRLQSDQFQLSRRRLLAAAGSAALVNLASTGTAHAGLVLTPRQTAGPFYPKSLPLDSDNDLVQVTGHQRQAAGTVTHVLGRVLDSDGRPLPDSKIEIWQCDSHGRYHYVDDRASPPLDLDFQGYGRTISAVDGSYAF